MDLSEPGGRLWRPSQISMSPEVAVGGSDRVTRSVRQWFVLEVCSQWLDPWGGLPNGLNSFARTRSPIENPQAPRTHVRALSTNASTASPSHAPNPSGPTETTSQVR